MTRIKKSRGSGQIGIRNKPAAEARQNRERPEETKKKGSGLKSGSRNSPVQNKATNPSSQAKKDPRHGSKTPIKLVVDAAEQKLMQQPAQFAPKAALSKAKAPQVSPEQELAQLEQDDRLMALLERVENGEILTGKDAKYFNSKTARHAELLTQLGLDEPEPVVPDDEDDDPLSRLEKTDWRKELMGD